MAEEKQFEKKVKDFLRSTPNIWFFKNWAGPYSKSGIPDLIACVNGTFVGIELKGPNGKASELQIRNINLIREAGGLGYILYPKDFELFKKHMLELIEGE